MNRHFPPWIALGVALVLTIVASLEVKKAIEQEAVAEFAFTGDQVTLKIQERLDAYALILKGGASFFAASGAIGRHEWQAYVETLRAQDSVPGVQGIGFSQVIPPHQLTDHIARIRAEGFPDYTVRPAGERALYTSIIYLEPFRDRNLRAFGFDMFSEPVRRAAMEQARDSGAPALSGKVELVQETGTEVQAGTLMYVPVYRNGAPTLTVEQRRAALIGWSYSPYRMKDLLEGILANWDDHKTKRVHLQIYAGREVSADSLLYESRPARTQKIDPIFYQQRIVDFSGRHWLLVFHAGEGVAPISYASAWATLAGGIVLSSLLCGLLLALARQVRAREIADTQAEEIRFSADLLRESEKLLSQAQKLSHTGSWKLDLTTKVLTWTDEVYRIFGYEPLAFAATYDAFLNAVHPEDRAMVDEAYTVSLRQGNDSYEIEHRIVRQHSGEVRYVHERCVHERGDAGTVIRSTGIVHDITERKRSEAELVRQAQRAQTLLQLPLLAEESSAEQAFLQRSLTLAEILTGSTVSFMHFVNDDEETIELVAWSQRTIDQYCHAVLKRHYPVSKAGIWADAVRQRVPRVCNDYANYPEKKGLPDGHAELIRFVSVPVIESGKVVMLTGVGNCATDYDDFDLDSVQLISNDIWRIVQRRRDQQDVMDQKAQLEIRVEQRTEALAAVTKTAEAASIAKSAFLANMSHEIRTPMNGIIGMAHILRREGVTPQQAKRLDTIDASAQHLLSVINDVLDLSKIEAGKFSLEEAPVVISSLLANVSSILAERAKAKGLHLLIEIGHLPQNLVGDPTRLQQALLNYVTNAVKFTETGSVTLRVLVQEETTESVQLRFEVQDTGTGITPEVMSRLFNAFEQADNSMNRKYGGTGLGLAITQRLVGLMGGKVGADSTAGVGSTFWFTVKLKKCDAVVVAPMTTTVDAEPELRRCYAGQRILVVDDEPINREVAVFQLEAVDLVVDRAEDGEEAVAMARKNRYTAIFIDMQMPKLNGLDATRQIRELPGYRDTPIIAMTANAFAEDKAQCLAAGMNDFLIKPFNPVELFAILLRLLSRQDR